ncbi:helix-turn-helix domain-containing protein [Nocardioides sp. 616]|uniref:helix-turn-helix transcriptional regulator n=1 Tax=Nocardioides sp. 616 TaxID=2268090 RepID=UPI000CE54985|nr:helix-turn-helix domain-containing protein [Nocardioides sp. 616]
MPANPTRSGTAPHPFGSRRHAPPGQSPILVDERALWDIDDVARFLRVTKQTIYSWRSTGYGPADFRVGKHLRWRAATVIQWTLSLEAAQ